MEADRLTRLLDPNSIAFVGGRRAELAMEQTDRLGFAGEIWAVNPHRERMAGRPTLASLDDVPQVPDGVFVGVGAEQAIEVVAQASRLGAGGAVVYASGFAETGDAGAELQERLVAAAGSMPLIGPNCHGLVNALSGAALWPDVHGCARVDRGVAIVTQSGNLAIDLTMQQRALPMTHVVTLGNQAVVSIPECLDALVDDGRVTAIGLHLEGLRDSAALARSALRAATAGIPLVVLKTGTTDGGAEIVVSHTASLAGPEAAYGALFGRYGIAQVDTAEQLLATLSLFHHYGRLPGNRLTSLSCSGGEASLAADLAATHGVVFPAFPGATTKRLEDLLDHRVTVANPLDYHAFIWGDRPRLEAVFTEALASGVDAGVLIIDFPAPGLDAEEWWPTIDAFVASVEETATPGVVSSTLPENLPEPVCRRLRDRGIPAIPGVPVALAALAAAASPQPGHAPVHAAPVEVTRSVLLDEAAGKARLRARGLPVPDGTVTDKLGAPDQALRLGFPVVVKSLAPAHRSEVGAVALGLNDRDAVAAAVTAMEHHGGNFYVERQVDGIVGELLVGVQNDHPVGWTLTIGAGGVLAELLADTVTILLPAEPAVILRRLQSLRVWRIFDGSRNRPRGDIEAAVEVIAAIAAGAVDQHWEVEVNPLLVCREGVWVADVLMKELQ